MSDHDRTDYARTDQGHPWLRALLLPGLAFVAGLLAMGWLLTRWDTAAPYLTWLKPPPPAAPATLQSAPHSNLAATTLANAAPIERRVTELQLRVDRIADRAEAASGNADRAEGLLVAFAARRALDRGLRLGYIEGLLRDRFGQSQPQAVATIISASHQPVTLEDLRVELDTLSPDLAGVGDKASWWDGFRRELAGMVIVRRANTPSLTPDARLTRARRMVDAGHVDRALAEIARLPARDKAANWIGRARRYNAAHNALDLIETSALLSPAHAEQQRERLEAETNEQP